MSAAPADDSVLMNIISSALELRDEGIEPPIEELCAGHEDLVPAVREAMGLAQDLPQIQAEGPRTDEYLGRVLRGRYRLDQRLGAGAMGVVYSGEDLELRRTVAVKILRTDVLGADEAEYRFIREAEVMAAVHHPAVITVYDRGTTGKDEHFLVMELLEGESLSYLLEQGRRRSVSRSVEDTDWIARELDCETLPEGSYLRTIVQWAADLASGLGSAHEAGVFHRDVKPSNVFIKKDGTALLLDFGIAASTQHATLMRDSGALGTPAYMAPESLDPAHPASAALDIYSLCATLYHMLVLRAPYSGSPSQIISSLRDKDPQPAYRIRKGLPRDLQAILDRGMARRPAQRYKSAEDLEADLRAFLDYRPVSVRPVSPVGRAWRRLRRSPAFFASIAVAVGLLSLVGGREWMAHYRVVRHEKFMDVYEHFPPGLTITEKDRRLVNEEERQAVADLLDRAVEYRDHPLPILALRAAFRLDHGDPLGASADAAVMAAELKSPYARALAQRYAQLPSDSDQAADLDLEGLPAPESRDELYLAGYHALRGRDYARALAVLNDERLRQYAPAQEFVIPLLEAMNRQLPPGEATQSSLENYQRAILLETQIGRRTATTAQLIGRSLVARERYREALEPLQDGVALCNWSYGLHLHLGVASRRLLHLERAETHLRAASLLRPKQIEPHSTLVRAYHEAERFEAARSVLAGSVFLASRSGRRERFLLEGEIEGVRALALHYEGDASAAQQAGALGAAKYSEAVALGAKRNLYYLPVCEAFASGDLEGILVHVAKLLHEQPMRWTRISGLIKWMPDDLNKEQSIAIRDYITALKDRIQHNDEVRGN